MNAWEWPQYVMAFLYVLAVLVHAASHGKEKRGKYNGPGAIIGAAISVWILYMGGFWS